MVPADYLRKRLQALINVEDHEVAAVLWSFVYFFCLLCGYYIIRPIREEMAVLGGVENLQWLFTGTFIAMLAVVPLFGWLTSRFQRDRFLPWAYLFFILNLVVFFVLFSSAIDRVYIARAFFIWVSVFNLFVVSVFWSLMADVYTNEQAKRLFGFIAAGGTTGAIVGPLITAGLVGIIGIEYLLLISVSFLSITLLAIRKLCHWSQGGTQARDKPISGGIIDGIKLVFRSPYLAGICLLIFFYTSMSTFLYFQQTQIFAENVASSEVRVMIFSAMETAVNVLTLITQVFLTGRFVKRFGVAISLAVIPTLLIIGFLALGFYSLLSTIIIVQVIRRAGNYSIMRPAREMLFVVLSREEKYKAKNFIDTAIYRGGDAFSSWVYAGLKGMGLGINTIAFIAVPITVVWIGVSYMLGIKQQEKSVRSALAGETA